MTDGAGLPAAAVVSPPVLLCAAAAGCCVALLCRPAPRRRMRCTLRRSSAEVADGRVPRSLRALPEGPGVPGAAAGVAVLVAVLAAVLLAVGPRGVLLAATGAAVLSGAGWLHACARQRTAAERGRRQTIEICDALAAELRSGQPAVHALRRAAEQHPPLGPAARICGLGGDVPEALRRAAGAGGVGGTGGLGGLGGMATVAAAWQVAEGSGARLVAALEQVADGLRSDDAASAELAAALSPARATARLLAVLPVFGLLLGSGLGGDPLGLLLGTPAGNVLLLSGVGLALAGTFWVERLATRVQR